MRHSEPGGCVAPLGLGGLGFGFPALTRWANVCRAPGAGIGVRLESSPKVDFVVKDQPQKRRLRLRTHKKERLADSPGHDLSCPYKGEYGSG